MDMILFGVMDSHPLTLITIAFEKLYVESLPKCSLLEVMIILQIY